MSAYAFFSAIELGSIYSLMVLGLYFSYRVLNIPDLTVDGSFTLGAAVSAVLAQQGHPVAGLAAGALAGALAGVVTALLQTKLKVQPILAGIITMTALYSINLMVMEGKANYPVDRENSVFTLFGTFVPTEYQGLALAVLAAMLGVTAGTLFLLTPLGLAVRATGDNEHMVRAFSVADDEMKIVGLALANLFTALSGGFIAQYNLYAEVRMGIGMVVIGLASLIIGEIAIGIFIKNTTVLSGMAAVLLGSVAYRWIVAAALEVNFSSSGLKLVTAVIVAVAMAFPAVEEKISLIQQKRRAG